MDVEVTSASRTGESLRHAAAALAVVTNEDIRRSGATNVPQALREVPGIFAAQRDANTWAISSRGFSSVNSEKLLVLSDTRSIYSPLFAGVLWDVQDYVLQDIDRIEVIRGPGAALWGSNAVNGVINITTRSAKDTQGTLLEFGGGDEQEVSTTARYGGTAGDHGFFRVFGRYTENDSSFHPALTSSDDSRLAHVGFRGDWDTSSVDALTVQGDVYAGDIGKLAPSINIIGRQGAQGDLLVHAGGGNVLGRWRHTFAENADMQLRFYYDRTHRNDPSFIDDLDTFDLDLQDRFRWGSSQEIIWGANYRLTDNRNEGKGVFAVDPTESKDTLFSAFVQDQINITRSAQLTIGTKAEHNDFSGFEIQPSIRLSWDVAANQTLWAAVSRAVRVPTRLERDTNVDVTDPTAPVVARLLGNKTFGSEKLVAYEMGYRWQPSDVLYTDVAVFDNQYRGLASLEFGTPFIDPGNGRTIVVPVVDENLTDGREVGGELLVTFAPSKMWRLTGNYTYTNLDLEPHGDDLNRGRFIEGSTPRHQFGLRSQLDLPRGVEFDAQLRRVGALRSLPDIVSGEGLPAYTELDLRVAWHSTEHLQLSIVGQNLLHSHHIEFGSIETRGEIQRSVSARVQWTH